MLRHKLTFIAPLQASFTQSLRYIRDYPLYFLAFIGLKLGLDLYVPDLVWTIINFFTQFIFGFPYHRVRPAYDYGLEQILVRSFIENLYLAFFCMSVSSYVLQGREVKQGFKARSFFAIYAFLMTIFFVRVLVSHIEIHLINPLDLGMIRYALYGFLMIFTLVIPLKLITFIPEKAINHHNASGLNAVFERTNGNFLCITALTLLLTTPIAVIGLYPYAASLPLKIVQYTLQTFCVLLTASASALIYKALK
jgi:hypothetical protein